jgi:hypothetical protein
MSAMPYAVLILATLTVKRFASQDELRVAMDGLQSQKREFLVLKWSSVLQSYQLITPTKLLH